MAMEGVVYTGRVCKVGPNWGFIKCDDPTLSDMFVIPQSCNAFGRQLPPMHAQVQFLVINDPKSGRQRAESVEPSASASGVANIAMDPSYAQAAQYAQFNPSPAGGAAFGQQGTQAAGGLTGVMAAINGNFGFIKQDQEGPDMFVLPPFPPVGSRVSYDIIIDPKTGRPRADNVSTLEAAPIWGEPGQQQRGATALDSLLDGMQGMEGMMQGFDAAALMQELQGAANAQMGGADAATIAALSGRSSGQMAAINQSGNFGFIKQDSGEADMFSLPPLFPIGTKLVYDVISDPKTGRPRAENVQSVDGTQAEVPSGGKGGYGPGKGKGKGDRGSPYQGGQPVFQSQEQLQAAMGQVQTGTIAKVNEKFGFITQDSGESDMFVFPPSCHAFNRELPPVGTRVQYHVIMDNRTGRPRAENVGPAPQMEQQMMMQPQDDSFGVWS